MAKRAAPVNEQHPARVTGKDGERSEPGWGRRKIHGEGRRTLTTRDRAPTMAATPTTEACAMIDSETIRHLWTHKTQDHPWLSDEELVIDRAEGVWVWTQRGQKLTDAFAGLAVVNVGHGRREIAEAVAEQTVRLAYYPT